MASSSAIGAGAGAGTEKADIQNLYEKYGPICNSEGFYQHSGECWSDALQMIMLYTDGIKEITQAGFINGIIDYDIVKKKCEPYITKKLEKYSNVNSKIIEQNLKSLVTYFQIVQKRFQRHYVAETRRLEGFGQIETYSKSIFTDKCLDDLQIISSESRSENTNKANKPGVRAAVMSKMTKEFIFADREEIIKQMKTNKKTSYNTTGKVETEIVNLIHLYSDFFDIDMIYEVSPIKDFKYNPDVLSMYLHITDWENTQGHAITFLTCGSQDYYYDNNRGIILFPWRKLLQRYTYESTKAENKRVKLFIGGETIVIHSDPSTSKDTVLFKSSMWPFLEYTHKGSRHFVTYVAEQEKPVEYTISSIFSSRSKETVLAAKVNTILYTFDLRTVDLDYSIHKIVQFFKKKKNYTPTPYNTGTGKFLQSRLRPEYGLVSSTATNSGGAYTRKKKRRKYTRKTRHL